MRETPIAGHAGQHFIHCFYCGSVGYFSCPNFFLYFQKSHDVKTEDAQQEKENSDAGAGTALLENTNTDAKAKSRIANSSAHINPVGCWYFQEHTLFP